jgi:uncharacterized protein (DUF2267 family)
VTVSALETTHQKTNVWLHDLKEIGDFQDESQAYSAFRAVLHSLRDRLTVDEAVDLGTQLPMMVCGFYYEVWKPFLAPNKERTKEEFMDSIRESLRANTTIDPEQAAKATFRLLDNKISEGEVEDIKSMLPNKLRAELWP